MAEPVGLRIMTEGAGGTSERRASVSRSVEMPTSTTNISTLLDRDRLLHAKAKLMKSRDRAAPDRCRESPDLVRVIDAWPTLPHALRAAILAMIESHQGKGEGEG
jgi:hypothetical protein